MWWCVACNSPCETYLTYLLLSLCINDWDKVFVITLQRPWMLPDAVDNSGRSGCQLLLSFVARAILDHCVILRTIIHTVRVPLLLLSPTTKRNKPSAQWKRLAYPRNVFAFPCHPPRFRIWLYFDVNWLNSTQLHWSFPSSLNQASLSSVPCRHPITDSCKAGKRA